MNEWVWSIGGMILTGETQVLGEKHYISLVVDEWMSMEHWWNDTDRGNGGTGRKALYSVVGRWMNEYGALVEWYWQVREEYSYGPTLSGTNATFAALGSTLNFLSEWSIRDDLSYDMTKVWSLFPMIHQYLFRQHHTKHFSSPIGSPTFQCCSGK